MNAAALGTSRTITRRSKSNFSFSFWFLDRPQRAAMNAIYAFCRTVDDIADDLDAPRQQVRRALSEWQDELDRVYSQTAEPRTPIGNDLRAAAQRYGVRCCDLADVLAGVARDLEPARYATMDDLEGYCMLVAAAVGLATLPVLGASPVTNRSYAVHLGLALQLTNILRDLRGDAERERIYVPQQLLLASGFPDDERTQLDWLRGDGDDPIYAPSGPMSRVSRRLAECARSHFEQSLAALPRPMPPGLLAAEIMASIYAELLERLIRRDGTLPLHSEIERISGSRKAFLAVRSRWRGHR